MENGTRDAICNIRSKHKEMIMNDTNVKSLIREILIGLLLKGTHMSMLISSRNFPKIITKMFKT